MLMKNNINQKAVTEVMGHANTDKKAIIEDWVDNIQPFIDEVHPYDVDDIVHVKSTTNS